MTDPFRRIADDYEVKEATDRVLMTNGWSWPRHIFPDDVGPGQHYRIETVRGSTPVGVWRRGFYLDDDQIAAQDERESRAWKARMLEAHRADWERREALLPEPLRARLDNFRAKGTSFETDGWGYELGVSELAVLYLKHDLEESDELAQYAAAEGTTGNQHGFAKTLAKALRDTPDLVSTTISALAPLGTGPYYDAKD